MSRKKKSLGITFTKSSIRSPVDPHRMIHAVIVECEKEDREQLVDDIAEGLDLLEEKYRNF